MGATLPLLARFVQGEDSALAKQKLARFYALNTFGGALGSLVSAYVVIPSLGLTWTMRSSAAVSLSIGVVAVVLGWRAVYSNANAQVIAGDRDDAHAKAEAAAGHIPMSDAVILSAGSGMLVFGCEVVMVHLLALVIGTSVYAFGLMLAIFLVCLSLGTPIATRLASRFGAGAAAIGFAAAGIALLALAARLGQAPRPLRRARPFGSLVDGPRAHARPRGDARARRAGRRDGHDVPARSCGPHARRASGPTWVA